MYILEVKGKVKAAYWIRRDAFKCMEHYIKDGVKPSIKFVPV